MKMTAKDKKVNIEVAKPMAYFVAIFFVGKKQFLLNVNLSSFWKK
jgi:hypothetical protein